MTALDAESTEQTTHATHDSMDLAEFGYEPELRRAIGPLASFAVAFSMISVSTGVFALFSGPFTTVGGWGIWLWLPVALGLMCICGVYSHVAARIPLTGYAYQWNSRPRRPPLRLVHRLDVLAGVRHRHRVGRA